MLYTILLYTYGFYAIFISAEISTIVYNTYFIKKDNISQSEIEMTNL